MLTSLISGGKPLCGTSERRLRRSTCSARLLTHSRAWASGTKGRGKGVRRSISIRHTCARVPISQPRGCDSIVKHTLEASLVQGEVYTGQGRSECQPRAGGKGQRRRCVGVARPGGQSRSQVGGQGRASACAGAHKESWLRALAAVGGQDYIGHAGEG